VKNLGITTKCPRPFDTITIDKNGNCYACECSGWLPKAIGNLQIQEIQTILDSHASDEIQKSIVNGSYKYCDEKLCSYLLDTRPETKNWKIKTPTRKLKHIRLGIDDSCNLSCPSCRLAQVFEKRGTRLRSRTRMADKIIRYLEQIDHDITVHLGSDGDPFASLVYRYFLRKCPRRKNIYFSVQTNGLLLYKMYNKNKWMFDQLKELGLSIDGCERETYEKLRRGGKFDKLCSNLDFIYRIKDKYNFRLVFHCVVQKTNYREMTKYVDFARLYGADRVWFNRIVDWKTYNNFSSHDVADKGNKQYKAFMEELSKLKHLANNTKNIIIEFPTLDIQ